MSESTEALQRLAALLRAPEQWPAGFSWDYTRPSCCAESLSRRLSNKQTALVDDATRGKIFVYADRHHPGRPKFADITPNHVAELIDLHLQGAL